MTTRLGFGPRDREILRLAVPALGALVAEPLYILADTAVVGRLGTPELGGLALASQILLVVLSLCIFLAYGTTAAVARLLGAGEQQQAARQAVQSLWMAFGIGVVTAAGAYLFATPLIRLLQGEGEVLTNGRIYLQVSAFGLPAMLIMLAGVGYLRGLQDTRRPLLVALVTAVGNLVLELILVFGLGYGIGASALSTVIFQWLGAALYLRWVATAVAQHGVALKPDRAAIGRLAVVGFDLFIRTTALRASFLGAAALAATIGDTALGGHEIAMAITSLVAFALDSVAIAGQAMLGERLGASNSDEAEAVSRRILQWGFGLGILAMVVLIATRPWIGRLFSTDPEVIAAAGVALWFVAIIQPVSGVVFALDGVLIGAGDMRFLARAMAGAAVVFLTLVVVVWRLDLGLGWLWAALTVFMVARLVPLMVRFRSRRWVVLGA